MENSKIKTKIVKMKSVCICERQIKRGYTLYYNTRKKPKTFEFQDIASPLKHVGIGTEYLSKQFSTNIVGAEGGD